MAAFEYTAIDAAGRRRKGVLEGDSGRQVRQALRDRGLTPMAVTQATAKRENGAAAGPRSSMARRLLAPRRAMSALELTLFTRQLATLVAAGLPVDESLHTIARQSDKRRLSALVMNVRGKVMEGHSLAVALAEYPSAFAAMYRSTVAAGEQSGYLHAVLENLANHTERRFEATRDLQMALFYPIMLAVVLVLVVIGLMIYVVPEVVTVFQEAGQELPGLTVALIAVSDFFRLYWWLVAGAALAAAIAARLLLRRPHVRLRWDRRLLSVPVAGKMARGGNASRYASTLAILTGSGVPLVDAMRIATETVANQWLKRRLADSVQRVSEGDSLRRALDAAGYFPPMFLHMVASGEASGELDAMLAKVADYQQKELARQATTLVQLLQPLMLLLMAGVVLTIVMATLVPILGINQLVA